MRSLSPVEAALCAAIGGSVLAVGIPAFVRDLHASRLVEPIDGLNRIAAAAAARAASESAVTPYPEGVGRTPSVVPMGKPAQDPPGTWDHPTWRLLDFRLEEPHAFSFAFESENGPDGSRFRATARGDLDGDGNLSTFVVSGTSPKGGAPSTAPLAMHREVE